MVRRGSGRGRGGGEDKGLGGRWGGLGITAADAAQALTSLRLLKAQVSPQIDAALLLPLQITLIILTPTPPFPLPTIFHPSLVLDFNLQFCFFCLPLLLLLLLLVAG